MEKLFWVWLECFVIRGFWSGVFRRELAAIITIYNSAAIFCRPILVQPSIVKQQARVAGLVNKMAASDAQQAPTEMDVILAMRKRADIQKQTDKNYMQRLKQQLANAIAQQNKNGG